MDPNVIHKIYVLDSQSYDIIWFVYRLNKLIPMIISNDDWDYSQYICRIAGSPTEIIVF